MNIEPLMCCGIKEYKGIGSNETPQQRLTNIVKHFQEQSITGRITCAFMIFSEHESQSSPPYHKINQLKEYIETNALGIIHQLPDTINPNTNNEIRVCIWNINHENVSRWMLQINN